MIQVEPALRADAPQLARMVNYHAERNVMLFRSAESIAASIEDWMVAVAYDRTGTETGRRLLGGGSLTTLSPELAEVRSLVIDTRSQGQGLGYRVVERLIEMARARGFQQLCALTLSPAFFAKLGFHHVAMERISPKVWIDCAYCPKNQCCDEYAMLMDLVPNPVLPDYSHMAIELPVRAPGRAVPADRLAGNAVP